MPTVQGMTLACIRVNVIAIRCQAEGAAVANHKSRGPRGGGGRKTGGQERSAEKRLAVGFECSLCARV